MAINRRTMNVSREAVWAALADGHTYDYWVVGTRHIRDVDEGFPHEGTALHYRIGWGPFRHEGHSEVCTADPGRTLELTIHAWPAAAVKVLIELHELADDRTEVVMTEHPTSGPFAVLHNPLFDLAIKARNVESLRRLERVAAGEAAPGSSEAPARA
jgi:uncharacterized protein YndB with AHSA1/START domain